MGRARSHPYGLRRLLRVRQARIVIVGGGFAGVWAAMGAVRRLRDSGAQEKVTVTLVCPDDALVIRPRLYEADLSGVRVLLRPMLSAVDVEHRQAAVERIDVNRRLLTLRGPSSGTLSYDQLVLCAGSEAPLPSDAEGVHRVDNYQRAVALQQAVATLSESRNARFSVTVIGAGFTGLELAAELADTLRRAARADGTLPTEASVCLVERASSVAPEFGPKARSAIIGALQSLGVEIRIGLAVTHLDGTGVTLAGGERIECDLAVWAASPKANRLNEQFGLPLDSRGRVTVDPHMATAIDGIWVAGDGARVTVDGRHLAPMSCQHAIPQGRQAGENAAATVLGGSLGHYRQPLYLTCLDLGSTGALVTSGFERNAIIASGVQGKRFKRFVNRSLIYPPTSPEMVKLLRLGKRATPGQAGAIMQRVALRSNVVRGALIALSEDRAEQHSRAGGPSVHV
jgi:NADH:ubiquinone reductase (H+-translocating)